MKLFKGKCKMCGQCCKGMVLHPSFKKSLTKWGNYLKSNLKYKPTSESRKEMVFLVRNFKEISYKEAVKLNPSIKKKRKDSLYYKCLALKDNKCSIHKDRFSICRDYPNYPYMKRAIFLINQINCGFTFNKKGLRFKEDLECFRKKEGFND